MSRLRKLIVNLARGHSGKLLARRLGLWPVALLVAFIPTTLVAVGQVADQPLVAPGTKLGWESAKLELVLRVSEKTQVRLEVYSPGFDPNDYRSPGELGDERYDKSDEPLKTVIQILDENGTVRLRKEYGVESHRWCKLIDGGLAAGDYLIEVEFFGNGKNAMAFKLSADPTKASLQVAPGSMQTYNVHGQEWQYPFSVDKREWSAPFTVGIYDGDGPKELLVRVREPSGKTRSLPTPGNQQWVRYKLEQPGNYRFGFSQPKSAKQYTNTVGFKVFMGDVKVRVVDESGNPVPGAKYRISGYYDRTVFLETIPEGWELVKVNTQFGMPLSGRRVMFGPGGGTVTYVLRPPQGTLAIAAEAVCGEQTWPVPLVLKVGNEQIRLGREGMAEVKLPVGEYPLEVEVSGALVDAPNRVKVVAGRVNGINIRLRPRVNLQVSAAPSPVTVGQEATITARMSTAFPYSIPAEMRIELADGLTSDKNPAVSASLSASHPVSLSLPVRAEQAGSYRVKAEASPCRASANASLEAKRPAEFSVQKKALTPRVRRGEQARFAITVSNNGQQAGRVRVLDQLPTGLHGQGLDEYLSLQPGESHIYQLAARVTAVSGVITNTVRLLNERGKVIDETSAQVEVLQPRLDLSRTLDKHVVVPGEEVRVCLQVANTGPVAVRYQLADIYPEWVEPQEPVRFGGQVQPGEKVEHCYTAKIAFGPEAEASFNARLTSDAGSLEAADQIKRVPLDITKSVEPKSVLVGGGAKFTATLHNPTDHPLSVRMVDTPARGLGIQPVKESLTLKAGEERQFSYQAQPSKTGLLENKVAVFVGNTPAAFPVKAVLKVLPQITPRRTSDIKLPFQVEGEGDGLLIAHRPPEGASYRAGSSRLDGKPIEEPRLAEDGRLIWKIPYQSKGVLSYSLDHERPLPMLGEPDLTLLVGDRQLPLVGKLSLDDYKKAKPLSVRQHNGIIREPVPGTVYHGADSTKIKIAAPYGQEVVVKVNGTPVSKDHLGEAKYNAIAGTQTLVYYAVPLQVGKNVIEVTTATASDRVEVFRAGRPAVLVVVPEKTVADGRTPIKLRIESRDKNGFTVGMGFVTVESSQEPMLADANLRESGYQVLLKDGVGELVLRPMASPGEVHLKLAKDQILSEAKVYVPGPTSALWVAQGSITVRYYGPVEIGARARGYIETPLAGGTLQGALGVSGGVDAGRAYYNPELHNQENPTKRFPLTGSGTQSKIPLESDDGIALKFDKEGFSIGYYKASLSLPGLSGLPKSTALVLRTRGNLEAGAFVTLLPSTEAQDEIVPDGTRTYRLSYSVKPGSEKVILRIGAVETELVPMRDYVIDYPTGHITLARPFWPTSEGAVPVRLLVSYAPETAPRDILAFGAGARYKVGQFGFGLAVASLDRGSTWQFGAELAFRSKTMKATLGYALQGGTGVITLSTSGHQGGLEAVGNLRYNGSLQGKLRVAAKVGKNGKVALEHRASTTSNRSAILYEHRLGSIAAGLGLGYEWTTATPSAIGRLGYKTGGLSITLTHRQSFSVAPSLSTFGFSYAFDANLKGEGELAYEWGTGLSGSFGLKQKLGPANLSISYSLPNASGGGNRARFGIRAPLPLSDRWSLDLSAGYDRDLASGDYQAAAGAGLRYKTDTLSATISVEGTIGSSGSKVTLRSGATGSLDERQTISYDANYVIDSEVHGRFTLAYAYRGRAFQVLTYHRMINEGGTSFEGELAPTWHPNLSFQLRPSAAYRVSLNDPGATLYQLGLAANYYFSRNLGLGGGVYYLWQPALGKSSMSFSVEGSFRVLDPLWLNLGYTFGGFYGLSPEARPGVYLRLDFLGASSGLANLGGEK